VQQILSDKYRRRAFSVIVVLLLASSLMLRYLWLPTLDSSLKLQGAQLLASVLEKLITSFVVTVVIGFFIFWLGPPSAQQAEMRILQSHEISVLLKAAVQPTERWWFRGGTGRYLRAVTLPEMAATARRTSSTRELHVQLIDPTEHSLCREYASYRRGVQSASGEQEEWTEERVRKEIYATLLTLFIAAKDHPLLKIEIILLRLYSSFRIDLSSKYVILTKEDPKAPAVMCDSGSYFYRAYMDDLVLSAKQGKPVLAAPFGSDVEMAAVRKHFAELDLLGGGMSDGPLASIVQTARTPRNPYA
jgi:hypothetical protein